MNDSALRLPGHMMAAMHRLDDAFKSLLPNICVALGGGTVLAARWGHRLSTDLDFHMHIKDLNSLKHTGFGVGSLNALALIAFARADAGSQSSIMNGFVEGECLGVSASLFASNSFQAPGETAQFVHGTFMPAMHSPDILAGKLGSRLLPRSAGGRPARVLQRDLLDIALAPQLEPGALQQALDGMAPKARETVAARLAEVGETWMDRSGRKILEPQYAVPMQDLPMTVHDAVLHGDESQMPHFEAMTNDWTEVGHAP